MTPNERDEIRRLAREFERAGRKVSTLIERVQFSDDDLDLILADYSARIMPAVAEIGRAMMKAAHNG